MEASPLLLLLLSLLPHALQAWGHLFAIIRNSCCPHAQCVYDTRTRSNTRQSCAFARSRLYISIPKWKLKLNVIQRVYAHSDYFQQAESLHVLLTGTHSHPVYSVNHYHFYFYFFLSVYSVPSYTNIHNHRDSHPLTLCLCIQLEKIPKPIEQPNEEEKKYVYTHVVQFTFWLLRKTCDETFHPHSTLFQLMSRIISLSNRMKEVCCDRHAHTKLAITICWSIIITLISTHFLWWFLFLWSFLSFWKKRKTFADNYVLLWYLETFRTPKQLFTHRICFVLGGVNNIYLWMITI